MLQSSVSRWHFIAAFLALGLVTAGFGLFMYSLVNRDDVEHTLPPVAERASEIITFWFGSDDGHIRLDEKRLALWASPNETQKETMAQRFIQDIKMVSDGQNKEWQHHPRGRLALILLLDPFSEILQQPKKALEENQRAMELALEGIKKNQDIDLSLVERAFFYRPLVDMESLVLQNRAVALYERLVEVAPASEKEFFGQWLEMAKQSRGIIHQCGRFPSRNEMLERPTTELERQFLQDSPPMIVPGASS